MLRELPEAMKGESDYGRWLFEAQRGQWEQEQQPEESSCCEKFSFAWP